MLTDPQLFFLDEPTSGLDPATAAELLRAMRSLSDSCATVIFTTHAVQDLSECDRVVFMARGGRVAFTGTVDEALQHFGVDRVENVYQRLAEGVPDDAIVRPENDPAEAGHADSPVLRITTFPGAVASRPHPSVRDAHPADTRHHSSQQVDARNPRRLADVGGRDDGGAVPPRRV